MKAKIPYLIVAAVLMSRMGLSAQDATLSGCVRDVAGGGPLAGAVVFTSDKSQGTYSDSIGFYSLTLSPGVYDVICSLVGYEADTLRTDAVNGGVRLDFHLRKKIQTLEEAVVHSITLEDMLVSPQMGKQSIDVGLARKLPALMGEDDIIRVVQMMPGVQSAGEGSTGFSVRGGGTDQNLILMDGAPVYNSGHFLGFLSVFNGDVIQDVNLYKGDFPAKYGSMISSVLDVTTAAGDRHDFAGSASIGLLSSKVHLSGPIVPQKLTFSIAAKRSYMDLFFPLVSRIPEGSKLAFFDANAKISWIPDENNHIQFSVFSSDDHFGFSMEDLSISNMLFGYRNNAQSVRWTHVFSPSLTSDFTLYNSLYKGSLETDMDESSFIWNKNLNETGIRNPYTWHINARNTLNFGWETAWIFLNPSECHPVGNSVITDVAAPSAHALSPALYVEEESQINVWRIRYGLRYSAFWRVGADEDKVWYHGLDPRLSLSCALNQKTALKASYVRSRQYLAQASISSTSGVLDTWFAASDAVKPQISDQFSLGASRIWMDNAVKFSLEGFYKKNRNTIDLKDNAGLVIIEPDPESLLRFGSSHAGGVEVMAEYSFRKINGWASYTWTRSIYDIEGVNDNVPYRSPLNHEHAVNVVVCWDISQRVTASATWVFSSGSPTTFPTGRFSYGGTYLPLYSSRNEDNMPDYHRADLSLTLRGKKRAEEKRWSGEWNFSVYNIYGRHNAWTISYGYNEKTDSMEANLIYLFSVVPSVSYNLKF